MRVTADTNILLRITIRDDRHQADAAEVALRQATLIAISLPTLCEFAWVLSQGYKQKPSQIELAIRALLDIQSVRIDSAAVEAGLEILSKGGDFADGVIAHEGRRLGGDTYLTFDKRAARLINASGGNAKLLLSGK